MEAVGRQGHLRPDDAQSGSRGGGSEDGNYRCDLSEGTPNGDQPAGEKGGSDDQRGRLIGRTKGGMNTKLHAVTDADGRPIRFFMTAGQVSDYTGAVARLSSLPAAEWLLGDRCYDADWFRDALKDKGIKPCIPGRKPRRRAGFDCPPDLLAHISPLGWAHILLTGEYRWAKIRENAL